MLETDEENYKFRQVTQFLPGERRQKQGKKYRTEGVGTRGWLQRNGMRADFTEAK